MVSVFSDLNFDYTEGRDEYVAEVSELSRRAGNPQRTLIIEKSDGSRRHYRIAHIDRNGGDIAGWWYHEIGGTGKVLVIND